MYELCVNNEALVFCHLTILGVTCLSISDFLGIKGVCLLREVVFQRSKAIFTHEEIHQLFGIRFGRVQLERLLSFGNAAGI